MKVYVLSSYQNPIIGIFSTVEEAEYWEELYGDSYLLEHELDPPRPRQYECWWCEASSTGTINASKRTSLFEPKSRSWNTRNPDEAVGYAYAATEEEAVANAKRQLVLAMSTPYVEGVIG